ncbi:MAG: hypothetical protein KatS3mg131_3061 [Candidatus Tectimicrobiota bacterium]|nr:MAG: hypothetical protein KatS3mg131_3061 [Candidatus Tectomicrobia bacterium]
MVEELVAAGSAGAVDQDVNGSQRVGHPLRQPLHLGGVGDVADQGQGEAACGGHLVRRFCEGIGVAGHQGHGGAGARQGHGDGAADAAAAAGHQCHFAA